MFPEDPSKNAAQGGAVCNTIFFLLQQMYSEKNLHINGSELMSAPIHPA